jgi:hypothetical protein
VVMVMLVIRFKFVVNSQDIPTLHCKADIVLLFPRLGATDWTQQRLDATERGLARARGRFSRGKSRKAAPADTVPLCSAYKMRFQGGCSEQDDSASGFAWVAREPELMFGAEGRSSSQRFQGYHDLPWYS